jgi:hypothetical protein
VYCYLDCENHLNAQRALAELKRHAASTKSTELIVGPGESRDIQKLIEVMRIYNEQHGQIYLDSYNELLQYKSNLVQHPLPIEELGDLVVGFRPA